MALLSLHDVSKSYPGVAAAASVNLSLAAGEVLGLVGKNGAGKSTIIRIIAGVERPDLGHIAINGETVRLGRAMDATRAGIAVVHQELGDIPSLTVGENIMLGLGYPRRFGLIDKKRLRDKARAALNAMQLKLDVDRSVASLSIAQRRMVMIARGIAADAKVVVLDEPTASLTETEIIDLFAVIKRMQANGVGVIYVSHRLGEVLELTSRVAVMRDGQLIGNRATHELDEVSLVELISGKSAHTRPPTKTSNGKVLGDVVLKVKGLVPLTGCPPITLMAKRGEIVGLAGLAGSGRSEILRQIMGADANPNVFHEIHRVPVKISNPRDAWSHGIALVPEDRRTQGAILQFTIARNVTLASLRKHSLSRFRGFPSKTKENLVTRQLIKELKIKVNDTETKIGTLSGGNQQKAILARCLAADAEILLLDEPTHGVDVDAKQEIYRVIRELAARGKAIVVVSSELREIEGLVDRALVMRDGHHIATLEGANVTEKAVLTHCFATGEA